MAAITAVEAAAGPPPRSICTSITNIHQPSTNCTLNSFTFLATLLLLLCVSSAIILRSYILRRRFRRHVEEAFYAGVWAGGDVPPGFPGNKRPNTVGPRPVMFDVYTPSGERKAEHEMWNDVQVRFSVIAILNTETDGAVARIGGRGASTLACSRATHAKFDRTTTGVVPPASPRSCPSLPTLHPTSIANGDDVPRISDRCAHA